MLTMIEAGCEWAWLAGCLCWTAAVILDPVCGPKAVSRFRLRRSDDFLRCGRRWQNVADRACVVVKELRLHTGEYEIQY